MPCLPCLNATFDTLSFLPTALDSSLPRWAVCVALKGGNNQVVLNNVAIRIDSFLAVVRAQLQFPFFSFCVPFPLSFPLCCIPLQHFLPVVCVCCLLFRRAEASMACVTSPTPLPGPVHSFHPFDPSFDQKFLLVHSFHPFDPSFDQKFRLDVYNLASLMHSCFSCLPHVGLSGVAATAFR